jgi:hypothetical protein
MSVRRKAKFKGIGIQLKRIHKAMGITLQDISQQSKVPVKDITAFEKGTKLPTGDYLRFLSIYHNVNLNFIYYNEKHMYRPKQEFTAVNFGIYNEEVSSLLQFMERHPQVLFAMLAFYYKYTGKSCTYFDAELPPDI